MKVSELKVGMLLRWQEPRYYKFLRDSGGDHWLDVGRAQNSSKNRPKILPGSNIGRPLIIYLGQKKMDDPSYYGGYRKVREISVDGRTAWMWPDAWKHLEAV